MKRKGISAAGIAVLLLLCFVGCGVQTDEYVKEEMSKTQEAIVENMLKTADEWSVVYADVEFARLIAENPIDRDFVWEDTGSEGRIRQAAKYKELWEAEIVHTFKVLKGYLSEQDFETLKQAYASWKEYLEQTFQIEQSIYYVGSNYDNGVITGNNLTYPQVMETAAERTKRYAIELMSLEYTFTGTLEFCAEKTAEEQR